jgi:hypothetical protein
LYELRLWLAAHPWSAIASLCIQVIVGGVVYLAVLMSLFGARILRYVRFLRDLRKGKTEPTEAGVEALS